MSHPVHVVVLVVVLLLVLARDLVQVGVVDGELSVVLLQYVSRCPLYGEFAQGKTPGLAVRTADHLDQVLGLAGVSELQQEEGEWSYMAAGLSKLSIVQLKKKVVSEMN